MDMLVIILVASLAAGLVSLGLAFLLASFPCKVKRKDRKHAIVRKLRSKAHHMEMASDIAKDATTNEKRVLEHLNTFLLSVADDVEEL